jgi:hypothetical protein
LLRSVSDYRQGYDWWPDLLTTYTTRNYAIANPHTLQITRSHAKSSQSAFTSRFLVTDLNNRDSSASALTSLLSGEYPTTELTLTLSLDYNISSRTEYKTPPPLLRVDSMCLPSRCPETCLVYPPISRSLHSNGSTRYNCLYDHALETKASGTVDR